MSLRSLLLLICGLALAGAASAQQAETLLLHQRPVGPRVIHQMAVMLPLPPAPAEPPGSSLYDQLAVQAALEWMVEHGYLSEMPGAGVDVKVTGDGIFVTWSGPGIHIVIVLPNGPFLPQVWPNRLMTATVLEVSNGF